MTFVKQVLQLTHAGSLAMLEAAVAKAEEIGQPQCIVIVDASGVALAQLRMAGAKYLSMQSATAKARTAASIGAPSDAIPEAVGPAIAAATNGHVTRLGGGLPIVIGDALVGGIGVGSGSPDQDKAVASAALKAVGANPQG
ncbi:MAG: heme-binding protein [Pseudomonadota bacterium]